MNEWQQMQWDRYAREVRGTTTTQAEGCFTWNGPCKRGRPVVYDGPAGRVEGVTKVLAEEAGHRYAGLWEMSCGDKSCVNPAHIVARERKQRGVYPKRVCAYCEAEKRQRATGFICERCTRTVRDLTFAIRKDGRVDVTNGQLHIAKKRIEEMVSSIITAETIRQS